MDSAAALPPAENVSGAAVGSRRSVSHRGHRERAQASALETLYAISSYLDSDADLQSFFGRLSATVARQLGADRAAFWRLGARGALHLQPDSFGFTADSPLNQTKLLLEGGRNGVLGDVVYRDQLALVSGTAPDLDRVWRQKGLPVANSIAASWRAGDRRIGAVVVYDSRTGFTRQDLWHLRVVGYSAGLLWQYREAEDDLGQTTVRLNEAMVARRHLLDNIAAGGDEARRRFASALHDDSLQLLTGAELQLERIRATVNGAPVGGQLDQLKQTLRQVEDSLRRLLINVSPEPLPISNDLGAVISERLEELRVRTGIEGHVETRLPTAIPPAVQAVVFKNISEALTNVVKHAQATRVMVTAEEVDGGLHIEVTDNGTGFVVAESVRVPGHIGLVALRERAQLAGGTCRVKSEPGTGTTIEFWVPLSA